MAATLFTTTTITSATNPTATPPLSILHLPSFETSGSSSNDHGHLLADNEILVEGDHNPRLPNGVVVAVLMAVGLVGNGLVLYVYHFKMRATVFSTFVTVLALLDLVTCLVGMPIDVAIKTARLPRGTALQAACKAAHLEAYSTSLASGGVLLLITVTRYIKVCHPLQPGLTLRTAHQLCGLILLGSLVLCLGTLVINGVEIVYVAVGLRDDHPASPNSTLSFNNNTATAGTKTIHDSESSLLFNNKIETDAASAALNATFNHLQNLSTDSSDSSSASGDNKLKEVVEVNICRTSEAYQGTVLYYGLQAVLFVAFVGVFLALLVLHCLISSSVADFERRRSSMRRMSLMSDPAEQQNLTHITAGMFRIFATITVIFVVSYLPHLVCLVVERVLFSTGGGGGAVWRGARVAMDLAYNCPYINVVANPFIYSYRSSVFRSQCTRLLAPITPACCRRRCRR